MNLAKTVVAPAASFRVAEAKEDCVFPNSADVDWRYVGPIIGSAVLGFLNLALLFRIAEVHNVRIR